MRSLQQLTASMQYLAKNHKELTYIDEGNVRTLFFNNVPFFGTVIKLTKNNDNTWNIFEVNNKLKELS